MTTEAQLRANKRNAKSSTGPKTRKGKATSSTNARTHGLTTAPEYASVLNWYNVVLNDINAVPSPFERNRVLQAAFRLAEAEARLERVRRAEEALQLEIQLPVQDDPADYDFPVEVIKQLNSETRSMIRLIRRAGKGREETQLKKMRVLGRYRRGAEAARHKALRRWLTARRTAAINAKRAPKRETNPITP